MLLFPVTANPPEAMLKALQEEPVPLCALPVDKVNGLVVVTRAAILTPWQPDAPEPPKQFVKVIVAAFVAAPKCTP